LASFNAASNVLAVPVVFAATALSLPVVAAAAAPVMTDALAVDEVDVDTIPLIVLLVEAVLVDDGVVVAPDVACCTLLTSAKICVELVLLGSLLLVELDELDEDVFPFFPFAPVLELVPLLELVPEVELLDEELEDDVEEVDELELLD